MMFKRLYFTTVLIGLLLTNTTHAVKKGNIFQAITTHGVIDKSLWYEFKGKRIYLYANSSIRSIDYDYLASENIIFYGDRKTPEGAPLPEAVARLPRVVTDTEKPIGRLLLIFNKAKKPQPNEPKYSILVIKDNLDGFPLGSFKFLNFTKTKVAVLLGEQNMILEKSAAKVFSEPPPEKGDVTVKLAYYSEDGKWEQFYTNGWGHSADLRTLVFLTSSGDQFKPLRFRQYDR
jgi:hypothetical protein